MSLQPVIADALADAARPGVASFRDVQALVSADMAGVDRLIRQDLRSDVVLINQIGEHIIGAGGKRLRPLLVLLAARAAGSVAENPAAIRLAAIVEFIHTATLLHDDVVDESGLRRGRATANALWGNAASVLVGDFLYSRAFQLMVGVDRMTVMRLMADTTNAIAEGEVLQLLHAGDPDLDEQRYLDVVRRKTAVLFAAGCQLGAIAAGACEDVQQALYRYGMDLGIAFQIADDVLDYSGDAQRIGKHLGDDLAEGKVTLPLILAQRRAEACQVEVLRLALREGRREALPEVVQVIRQTDALDGALDAAREHSERAIQHLDGIDAGLYCEALEDLARFAVSRSL